MTSKELVDRREVTKMSDTVRVPRETLDRLIEYFKIQEIVRRVSCYDDGGDMTPDEVEHHNIMHFVATDFVQKLEAARDGK